MIKDIITDELQLSKECTAFDFSPDVIADLIDTANYCRKLPRGCSGLAANQIGYDNRIVVVLFEGKFKVMVNPSFSPVTRWGTKWMKEGCLSRPGISPKVVRHKCIIVNYLDENQVPVERKFSGITARVIQHEIDHLNGEYIK